MKAARTTTTLNFHCPKTREDMSIVDGQEFCSACNRSLVDFTLMNDEELKTALAKLAGTKSCGAFRPEQVTLSAKQKFVQRLRQVASLTIALFSIKAASAKTGDVAVPATQNESEESNSYQSVRNAPGSFYGRLVNMKNFDGISYNEVYLTNAEGEILQKAETDANGVFHFDLSGMADSTNLRVVTNTYSYKNSSVPLKVGPNAFTYFLLDEQMNLYVDADLELSLLKRVAYKEKRMFFPYMRGKDYPRVYGAF